MLFNMYTKKRIVVGMSGGVDSSVAAWLLKKAGHEVIGVFMKNWEENENDPHCSIKQDVLDAVAVADIIGIDIHVVNFAKAYRDKVFCYFLDEYAAGRTPNPDVLCNTEIKFKVFLEHALSLGAQLMATGHYAQIEKKKEKFYLLKGVDPTKDQSYFLYQLNQHQLSHAIFPLGKYHKKEVRKIAKAVGLPVAEKKDSTGICFIGKRPFREFLNHYIPAQPGSITTSNGTILGQHIGLMFYTIGQRKGLNIGGQGEAWYVADKDLVNNRLIVVQGHDHPALFKKQLALSDHHWIIDSNPKKMHYQAKIRYQSMDAKCTLQAQDGYYLLNFHLPQWAVTSGQSAVIYDKNTCLGGGIIL